MPIQNTECPAIIDSLPINTSGYNITFTMLRTEIDHNHHRSSAFYGSGFIPKSIH